MVALITIALLIIVGTGFFDSTTANEQMTRNYTYNAIAQMEAESALRTAEATIAAQDDSERIPPTTLLVDAVASEDITQIIEINLAAPSDTDYTTVYSISATDSPTESWYMQPQSWWADHGDEARSLQDPAGNNDPPRFIIEQVFSQNSGSLVANEKYDGNEETVFYRTTGRGYSGFSNSAEATLQSGYARKYQGGI